MCRKPSENQIHIATAIKHLRTQKGHSQHILAEIAGVSTKTVNYIERALSPAQIDTLEILAETLDTTVLDIIILGKELKMAKKPRLQDVVAKNVRHLRLAQKMTQHDVGSKIGITASYISNVESGKYGLGLDVLEKLAVALDVEETVLIDRSLTEDSID